MNYVGFDEDDDISFADEKEPVQIQIEPDDSLYIKSTHVIPEAERIGKYVGEFSKQTYYLANALDTLSHALENGLCSLVDAQNRVKHYISTLRTKWFLDQHKMEFSNTDINILTRRNFGLYEQPQKICELMGSDWTDGLIINESDIINFMESYLLKEVMVAQYACIRTQIINDYEDELQKILGVIYHASAFIKNISSTKNIFRNGLDVNTIDFAMIGAKFEHANLYIHDKREHPMLMDYITHRIIENDLRKFNNYLYRKIYTPEGFFTRAWKKVISVRDFCYRECSKERNMKMYLNFYNSSERPESVVRSIIANQSGILADITPSRFVFAFRNGIYYSNYQPDIKVNDFYDILVPFSKINKYIPSDQFASKYFDTDLDFYQDPEFVERYPHLAEDLNDVGDSHIMKDWFEIPTPSVQRILDTQFYDEDDEIKENSISRMHYMYIGRWCFPVGCHDNWQTVMMIKGIGGTGKSTILKIMANFWDSTHVGTINNDIEKQFGLSSLAKYYGNLGIDLNNTFAMSPTVFQSMISGEQMSLSVKFQESKQVEAWTSSTFLAGNTDLGFTDFNGSIPRRVVQSLFIKSIPSSKIDGSIERNAIKELPNFLHKSVRAYLTYVRKYKTESFWNFCPKYFWTNRMELASNSNSLTRFCKDRDYIMIGSEYYIPKQLFIDHYKAYCNRNNLEQRTFQRDSYLDTFEGIQQLFNVTIRVAIDTKLYPRPQSIEGGSSIENMGKASDMVSGNFIFGLDIRPKPTNV